LNSRYYSPERGRFINADSMTDGGAGLLGNNLFIYCADNPVNNFDPSGSSIIDVLNRADKNIREAVVKTISKTKGTYTKGFSLTGTPGI